MAVRYGWSDILALILRESQGLPVLDSYPNCGESERFGSSKTPLHLAEDSADILDRDIYEHLVGKAPATLLITAMRCLLPPGNFLRGLEELPVPASFKPLSSLRKHEQALRV